MNRGVGHGLGLIIGRRSHSADLFFGSDYRSKKKLKSGGPVELRPMPAGQ
jgi:hypothetical protein